MRRLIPVLILLLAVVGFVILRATRPLVPPVEVRERVWRVEAHELTSTTARPTLVLYGRIEAPDRIRAAAPIGGRIIEVKVRDGDQVEAGAVLARMDPRDLQPRIAQATADVERERIRHRHDQEAIAQERTLLQLAEAKLARFERLKNARLGAESAFDQAREEVARVRLSLSQRQQAITEHPSRLAQLQAKLAEARRDAERGEITAPFAARIGKVEVAAGDQVQPGQVLLSLYASDALYLRARVPVDTPRNCATRWRGARSWRRRPSSVRPPCSPVSTASAARPTRAALTSCCASTMRAGSRSAPSSTPCSSARPRATCSPYRPRRCTAATAST